MIPAKNAKRNSSACPNVTALNLLDYPYSYRTNVTLAPNETFIGVSYPCNDMLMWGQKQAAYPPDSATAVTNGFSTGTHLQDPFLLDLLTPVSTSADPIERPQVRPTTHCVEITTVTALANVSGDTMLGVWRSACFPNIGSPAGYSQAYSQFVEDPYMRIIPGASYTAPVCIHAAMRDRNALEPTTATLGPTAYNDQLRVNTGSTAADYVGVQSPWYPVCIYLANPSAVSLNYVLTVRGMMQVNPAVNSSWFRVAVPRPVSASGMETKWWQQQKRLLELGPTAASNSLARNKGGFTGVPDNGTPVPRRPPASNRRKFNLRGNPNVANKGVRVVNVPPVKKATNGMANSLVQKAMSSLVEGALSAYLNSGRGAAGPVPLITHVP